MYDEYSISDIHKENVIYTGTKNQVRWVKDKLIEKGICEKEIVVDKRGFHMESKELLKDEEEVLYKAVDEYEEDGKCSKQ